MTRAARDLLDEAGIERFSMNRLAERLAVTPMALYRHFSDREELEQSIVELVLGELGGDASTSGDWEAAVAGWMHGLRSCWLAHPWVGALLGSRAELSRSWLLALDRLSAALARAGLRPAAASRELVHISRETVGILWQEVNAPLPHAGLTDAVIAHLPSEAQLRWRGIGRSLDTFSNDDLFDAVVQATLNRLREPNDQ